MDIKNSVEFAVTIDGRKYAFSVPADGNLGEAFSAAYQVLVEISQRIQQVTQAACPPATPTEDSNGQK